MTDINKFLPVHIDLHDPILRNLLENELKKLIPPTHRVSHLGRLNDEIWLVRAEYSAEKDVDPSSGATYTKG